MVATDSEPAQTSSNPPTISINEILEEYIDDRGNTNYAGLETALYTLIESVRPEEKPTTPFGSSGDNIHDIGYNRGVQDYDNAIKEVFGE